ncbi:hypothetical protein LTR05_007310 [Lithohypha guttulata]|uniref:Uncharacterized protein n=1 Tax=Lithohypha guttulata TaxID=1690604 RepID=A0AAN7SUW9_9EURO|nr:hypothetical protein LTR05_007310 [Lithohypha guttulata]
MGSSFDRDTVKSKTHTRHSSITSIPRPSSGSSRQADPIRKTSKSCLTRTPLPSPEGARRPVRRFLMDRNHDLPRSVLPGSDTILPHLDTYEPLEDVSAIPAQATVRSLVKSQTTPALLSPHVDIPARSLLRPLPAPLPRSCTYDDIAPPRQVLGPSQYTAQTPPKKEKERGALSVRNWLPVSPYVFLSGRKTRSEEDVSCHAAGQLQHGQSKYLIESEEFVGERHVHVHTAQPAQYWLGRYMAMLDRLRTTKLIPAPPATNHDRRIIRRAKTSMEFDRAEKDIKAEALGVLRSLCQTQAAYDSFKTFTVSLRAKDPDFMPPGIKTSSQTLRGQTERRAHAAEPGQPPTKAERRDLTGTLPRTTFRKPPVSKPPRYLTKSFTLDTFSSKGSVDSLDSVSKRGQARFQTHDQQELEQGNIQGRQGRSTRETFAESSSDQQCPATQRNTGPSIMKLRISPTSRDRKVTAVPANTFASHAQVDTVTPSISSYPSMYQLAPAADGGEERYTHQVESPGQGRRFRKSESMKKLVDVSLKELKKMGHRVSNTSASDGKQDI